MRAECRHSRQRTTMVGIAPSSVSRTHSTTEVRFLPSYPAEEPTMGGSVELSLGGTSGLILDCSEAAGQRNRGRHAKSSHPKPGNRLSNKVGDHMGRGESGTGWSMSIWPRGPSVEGADPKFRVLNKKPKPRSKGDLEVARLSNFKKSGKITRSFISQCAASYEAKTLTAKSPAPPAGLQGEVSKAGGNIEWLGLDKSRRVLFHQFVCRLSGSPRPYDRIWGPRKR